MKKFLFIFAVIVIGFVLISRSVFFVWVNPYTQTSSYSYIAKTVKGIEKALRFAQKSAKKDGNSFEYVFENAYGSGFLNSNPIPNDLDFAVGIDLGTFEFNGKNSEEIAISIIDKMEAFQYFFNIYINTLSDGSFFIDKTYFDLMGIIAKQRQKNIKAITESLPQAVSGKDYIKHTSKIVEDGSDLDLPYIMKANEILIEDYDPIMLYSDLVEYNSSMPKYVRSISIIPEFFAKIKYEEKTVNIEIVPESFRGERMQLVRRFFASSVFTAYESKNFLKNSFINDDEKYLYYRMISYKRHLQEISNIQIMQDRPVKMLKRFMQTADISKPLIGEAYLDIQQIVEQNMQNRDIQLLNEYINICTTIYLIQEHPVLYLNLKNVGKIDVMYKVLLSVVDELDGRGNIDKTSFNILKNFALNDLSKLPMIENKAEVFLFKKEIFDKKYKLVNDTANILVYSLIQNKEKLDKYALIFEKIYTDAGYHRIMLYWLDENTIGILKDEFTENIKDLKQFAKENELTEVDYKLISKTQIPRLAVKYGVWVRYNSSETENNNYEKMKKALLDDKKNFNIKQKFVISF